ncbi:uncharacterized protein LOC117175449 [Belonocnema kinseyi]|uniref:uncharacterized protein LOC117175449 n=1 Tax=Belonocnema kinseyi TaxID=2817044 RepID=UPI00143D5BD9|nr:uncharacterized protein LOC117175449 [Belonocnema kinseyi]
MKLSKKHFSVDDYCLLLKKKNITIHFLSAWSSFILREQFTGICSGDSSKSCSRYAFTVSGCKMKIIILLFTCVDFLYSLELNAAYKSSGENRNGNHDEKLSSESIAIPERSRVYVQMAGDHVFTGNLQYIYKSPIPIWVLRPNHAHHPVNLMDNVFIQMPNGEGLTASVHSLTERVKNSKNNENSCFVRIRNHSLLVAFLEPYHHDPAENYENPIVYVRMPEEDDTVYSGELHYGDGYLPSWFNWDD